jgi:Ca-activated chloride channel family protein
VPPEEVQIDALISSVDYDYPLPQANEFNVITSADVQDTTAYIQVGLKGKKDAFETLPPLNICFVIDMSGSMSAGDKLSWVKDSFYIFINKVRPNDIISVVAFDDKTEVLVEPTQIKNEADRTQFKRRVDTLRPRGGTDIFQGMTLGYSQVERNYRPDYTNRVLLLTDGMHNGTGTKDDILSRVAQYNSKNITISTIALGAAADINLIVDMATKGGGSSRFISDHDKMEETFGSELDRLIVPAARMLNMELQLADGIKLRETWGYNYWVENNTIHYSIDTIHNGDYETIMAVADLEKPLETGGNLGVFSIAYESINGEKHRKTSYNINLSNEAAQNRRAIIDRRIQESECFIAYGKCLIETAETTKSITKFEQEYERSKNPATKDQIISYLSNGVKKINSVSAHLAEISAALGGNKFADELLTLSNYEKSFTDAYNRFTAPVGGE